MVVVIVNSHRVTPIAAKFCGWHFEVDHIVIYRPMDLQTKLISLSISLLDLSFIFPNVDKGKWNSCLVIWMLNVNLGKCDVTEFRTHQAFSHTLQARLLTWIVMYDMARSFVRLINEPAIQSVRRPGWLSSLQTKRIIIHLNVISSSKFHRNTMFNYSLWSL